jgi:hypothetical protein
MKYLTSACQLLRAFANQPVVFKELTKTIPFGCKGHAFPENYKDRGSKPVTTIQ